MSRVRSTRLKSSWDAHESSLRIWLRREHIFWLQITSNLCWCQDHRDAECNQSHAIVELEHEHENGGMIMIQFKDGTSLYLFRMFLSFFEDGDRVWIHLVGVVEFPSTIDPITIVMGCT